VARRPARKTQSSERGRNFFPAALAGAPAICYYREIVIRDSPVERVAAARVPTGAEIKAGFMAGRRATCFSRLWVRGTPIALSPPGHLETERTVTMATPRPA